MLHLYAWSTPNGYKPLIMLHELGAEFELHPVPLNGAQKAPEYLRLNPNGKIPTLRVSEGENSETDFPVFESGAILTYLAETHHQFLPADPAAKAKVLEWVFFQNASVGPMLGQYGFFKRADEKNPMALERYSQEARRILNVLDTRLQEVPYLAGHDYTIADITTHPWVRNLSFYDIEAGEFPHLDAWIARVGERPAVQKAYATEFKPS